MKKEIKNITELNEDVLVRLFDRTVYINQIILLNSNAHNNYQHINNYINSVILNRVTIGYTCVLYRSLFQNAEWEPKAIYRIDKEILLGEKYDSFAWIHNEIIHFTDKVVAHQDASTSKRAVINTDALDNVQIVTEHSPSIQGLLPQMIEIIQKNVGDTYFQKTGKKINLF